MRQVLVVLAAVLIICTEAQAKTWTAVWEPATDNVGVTGYVLSVQENDMVRRIDVGAVTEYRFVGGDTLCAWVQAYDAAGNSSIACAPACVQSVTVLVGDFNQDGAINVYDNILFNYAWTAFIVDGIYNPLYDLWPATKDNKINIYDKLEFNKRRFAQ